MSEKKKKVRSVYLRVVTAIRREWTKSPERNEVKKRVRHLQEKHLWRCELCSTYHEKIYIDHIIPVVRPDEGFVNWDQFIKGMFVPASNLQALCHDCHKAKTQEENKIRSEVARANRKKKK